MPLKQNTIIFRLITAILILNPVSFSVIAVLFITLYVTVLWAVSVYSCAFICVEFIVVELGPYLDKDAMKFVYENASRVFPLSAPSEIGASGPHGQIQHDDNIFPAGISGKIMFRFSPASLPLKSQKIPILKHPVLGPLFMAGPFTSYLFTRIITQIFLSLLQWVAIKAIAIVPHIISSAQKIYVLAVRQLRWIQNFCIFLWENIIVKILALLNPILQWAKLQIFNLTDLVFATLVVQVPTLWIKAKRASAKFLKRVAKVYAKAHRVVQSIYDDYLIPVIERIRQIVIRILPLAQMALLTIVRACEELHEECRPTIEYLAGVLRASVAWLTVFAYFGYILVKDALRWIVYPFTLVALGVYKQINHIISFTKRKFFAVCTKLKHVWKKVYRVFNKHIRPTALKVYSEIRKLCWAICSALIGLYTYIYDSGKQLGIWSWLQKLPSRTVVLFQQTTENFKYVWAQIISLSTYVLTLINSYVLLIGTWIFEQTLIVKQLANNVHSSFQQRFANKKT